MVDANTPPDDADGNAEDRPDETPSRSTRRKLDGRTIAICVCIALMAALLAGLIASMVLDTDADDNASSGSDMSLSEPTEIDTTRLLAQPLETVDGGSTNVGSYLDEQPMLINIWASNCAPCIEEMPLLQEAADANTDVTFVGVSTQDEPSKAAELAEQTGISYPWALDPTGEFFYEAKGAGMPTTLLLSADGDVIASRNGAFTSKADLQAFIDQAS